MSRQASRATLKHFLKGTSSVLLVAAGASFFFG
jgi:hypothetical protein